MTVPVRTLLRGAIFGLSVPFCSLAIAETAAPLSVIDWLDKPAPQARLPRAPIITTPKPLQTPKPIDEPAVTKSGSAPQVTTRPLGAAVPRNVGLVPASVTGMKPDLWAGSPVAALTRRIDALPELGLPAANALLFSLLLAETAPPKEGAQALDTLTLARVKKLEALGAVDPAMALAEQAGAMTSRRLFDVWAQLNMLVGTEDTACDALAKAPYLTQDSAIKIFCAARGGDWDTAMLTFGSAKALSLIPMEKLNVLDRFLNPDLFEDAPPLATPREMDPLTFRLFETIGEPLPTRPLPYAYAVADLRDVAGWKAQLEAAERLTRTGALPDNRLLGLLTDRKAAASGGVWDHVRAVQRFDTALNTRSVDAISKTLPPAWREMQSAELEVSFSTSFQERSNGLALSGSSARILAYMGLLSPSYETVAATLPQDLDLGPNDALLRAIARGEAPETAPTAALPRAIYDAFETPTPNLAWMAMAKSHRLGEALLFTLDDLRDGAQGDSQSLRRALSTLRALGLEDTARRAALQILLLERS
ncbi:hypothetical protein [Sulfitobacter donghicola]|uniref:Antifreeze glycopeptide polyprotein n=1 Tax=Sulfitobacter donghicola DSW-25 = KCTC 12864 = JCM 14565 TaxID=1300350 RepID=A0A073IDA3_9RHOB|nr:hypothetical protein [Sulfitobacter donghicola]KEJ88348.1 hypothetical protein DSW25_14700 [Sulfitobacter donghicola DSW-25 = KCTC 12864 = JCM 14565]KIN69791.1 hypothetical protein Z948_3540 [Sulfitobacter donghicola DSW-25 = KCTC 12864 = JCM 14565]